MPSAAVFGSSLAASGDRCCILAGQLGEGLARLGYDLKTGGYAGVMEAASRGARACGGHVVGVTLEGLTRVRTPNPHLTREIRETDLFARLRTLVKDTDIFFAVECGGPGTLNEVFLVWSLNVIGELPGRPIVLVGSGWAELLDLLRTRFAVNDALSGSIYLARDVESALDHAARLLHED
jgi:uncharacterized protein (TIGR00730 family)